MSEKLSEVRELMLQAGVDAYFLPHNDPHNNEYLAEPDKRMPFISGFKGSNGQMLITLSQALLWTDGRYWIAAGKELYEGWTLMKLKKGEPRYYEWIVQNLPKGFVVGFDPKIITAEALENRRKYFQDLGYEFRALEQNLVNSVWTDRPGYSEEPVTVLDVQYSGASIKDKVNQIRPKMKELNQHYLFTGVMDEIAWLLNLRGNDIEYNPLFFSYLLVHIPNDHEFNLHLFVNYHKVEPIHSYLRENHVTIHDYSDVEHFITEVTSPVVIDKSETNYFIFSKLKEPFHAKSIISHLKAIKNSTECEGFRNCHIRDGIAVCRYFAWIKDQLHKGNQVTEWTGSEELRKLRAEEPLNKGLSFSTISSVGPNAAIIHYEPTEESAAQITAQSIYLLDSGGHYLDGTTDTTRTVHFGEPSDWEKECYTRVLLGNLDLVRVVWPKWSNLSGNEIELLARRHLWEKGLDFQHATGHGVGHYLCVHEGPQVLSIGCKEPFEVGMNVTNEPGYYEEGAFGIRIEDVMLVVEKNPGFIGFENVTMVPYEKNLMKLEMISDKDKEFINNYHSVVWDKLSRVLEERRDYFTLEWLREATSPI